MDPKKLKHRITLQVRSEAKDTSGAQVQAWTNVVTAGDGKVWACIEDMKPRQYIAAASVQNTVITKITIRYRAGVVPAMRALHGADIYDIDAVMGSDRVWLDLMCKRGANNG